ncbi:MAG: glycosyltransferase family 39 protein, partial [Candidatus Shapirobacteria bacterium]|nr:glycosyltransferase family 39 protein [Candidatus Shapirobacteria bacterium]
MKKNQFLSKNGFLILIALILILAAFLRFWQLPEYMTFLGDEGRDALAVKRMIVDHKFRLIGPVTSVGNMYLGPLYYYLMLPAMMVSRLSPIGPAMMVALLSVLTTFLIYFYGRELIGKKSSLFAAFLYAVSPVIITFSRSSWNPNVMPFFALVSIYGLWRIWYKKQFFWLPILGVTISFALQSHWLGLLLLPTIIIFWSMALVELLRSKKSTGKFWQQTLIGFFIFLCLTVAPLVWFDLRHGSLNSNAFIVFITDRQGPVSLKINQILPNLWNLNKEVFTRLIGAKNVFWGYWIALIITLMVILKLIRESLLASWHRFITRNPGLFLILVWFLVGLLGLGVYQQNIYDHYFGFIFPLPFLLTGWFLAMIWHGKKPGRVLAILFLGFLIFLAINESPLRSSPNRQLQRTEEISQFILDKVGNKPFNLALIAENNY